MSISTKYIYVTILLLIIELIIAVYVRDQFIRPFFGDVLVVMLIFSFFRIFYKGKGTSLGIGVLVFAFTIEILQYFQLVEILGIQDNKIAATILGATFDWLDLLAYVVGVCISIFLDKKFVRSSLRGSMTK